MNKNLEEILDRKDLTLDDKLKLYHQSLTRYLFLQHEAKKPLQATLQVPTIVHTPSFSQSPVTAPQTITRNHTVNLQSSDEDIAQSPILRRKRNSSTPMQSRRITTNQNNHMKDILRDATTPRYRNNLPRVTPVAEILRKERHVKRRSDFFYGWDSNYNE